MEDDDLINNVIARRHNVIAIDHSQSHYAVGLWLVFLLV